MEDSVHISSLFITIAGTLISLLLAVIAFFLVRMVGTVDGVAKEIGVLNLTMLKIDKDLSGKVGVLENDHETISDRVTKVESMFDRVRSVEDRVTKIEAGGCHVVDRCKA